MDNLIKELQNLNNETKEFFKTLREELEFEMDKVLKDIDKVNEEYKNLLKRNPELKKIIKNQSKVEEES